MSRGLLEVRPGVIRPTRNQQQPLAKKATSPEREDRKLSVPISGKNWGLERGNTLFEIMQGTKNLCLPRPSLVSLLYVWPPEERHVLRSCCWGPLMLTQTAALSDACNSLTSDHCAQPLPAQTLGKADRKILQQNCSKQQCDAKQMCWGATLSALKCGVSFLSPSPCLSYCFLRWQGSHLWELSVTSWKRKLKPFFFKKCWYLSCSEFWRLPSYPQIPVIPQTQAKQPVAPQQPSPACALHVR